MSNLTGKDGKPITKAIIYCRVSSARQVREGGGLDAQEQRCTELARKSGLEVLRIFREEGKSGDFDLEKRPQLMALLTFTTASKEPLAIIVNDVTRWARNTGLHISFKNTLEKAGGRLVYVNHNFDDTPSGAFMETVNVALGELERKNNKIRVRQLTEAQLRRGNYPWAKPPYGYRRTGNNSDKGIYLDPTLAAIIRAMFEGFANGQFASQQHIVDWLNENPDYKRTRPHPATLTWVRSTLENCVYAGYVRYEPWKVPLTKAIHEAVVSPAIFHEVQRRLKNRPKHKIYEKWRADFPLRGFIICDDCRNPFTSSWCSGNGGKYPYYYCKTKGCKPKPKMNLATTMHEQFAEVLLKLTPHPTVLCVLEDILKDGYGEKAASFKKVQNLKSAEANDLSNEISELVGAIVKERDPQIEKEIRKRVDMLRLRRDAIEDDICQLPSLPDVEGIVRKAIGFMSDMNLLWKAGERKKTEMVLNLAFNGKIHFKSGVGFKTDEISLPFKTIMQPVHREAGIGGGRSHDRTRLSSRNSL